MAPFYSHAATASALFENFEDSNVPGVQYTLHDFSSGTLGSVITENSDLPAQADYATTIRYDAHPKNAIPGDALTNQQGDKYFGFEDVNSISGVPANRFAIQWANIDISAFGSDYTFSAFFGELDDGLAEDWDPNDSITIWASKDSAAFIQIFGIEAEIGISEPPRIDTNFDGTGDGAEITTQMTQFDVDLGSNLGAGNNLTLQIRTAGLGSGDEDIAIDNVSVFGVVPEPSTSLLLSLFGIFQLLRRSRK